MPRYRPNNYFKQLMHEARAGIFKMALELAHGSWKDASAFLGIADTHMIQTVGKFHPELREYAASLREKHKKTLAEETKEE